jgi:hypothetical protein
MQLPRGAAFAGTPQRSDAGIVYVPRLGFIISTFHARARLAGPQSKQGVQRRAAHEVARRHTGAQGGARQRARAGGARGGGARLTKASAALVGRERMVRRDVRAS